jgi:hypothetical protein
MVVIELLKITEMPMTMISMTSIRGRQLRGTALGGAVETLSKGVGRLRRDVSFGMVTVLTHRTQIV